MKNTKAPKMPLSQLVKRIPFNIVLHLNREHVHSTIHKNVLLCILCETHTHYKDGKIGKSERSFCEDMPGSKGYDSLRKLLKENRHIEEKARKLYEKRQQNKKTKHFSRKECV